MNLRPFFIVALMSPIVSVAQTITVTADFDTWEEYPLVKKIGVYETPLVTRPWIFRDVPKMAELESRCFRYEFAWGKDLYTSSDITGTATSLRYDWSNSDYLFDMVAPHAPAIVFCHGYTPHPLTDGAGGLAWQAPPTNYESWRSVNRTATKHWKEKGYSNRYIEVWNEPDLPGGFFSGTVDDYVRVYEHAALGVKDADADAKVGGPGGALQWWHMPLVEHSLANNLPLDFISGHAYGTDFIWQMEAMRTALNRLGNQNAEMLLTEYSPYPAAQYAANGPVERAEAAMTFFQAIPKMLEYTDLSYVTWAQYIDPQAGTSGQAFSDWDKLGLIDGNYGFRKALFNAFKLYGMMPVDRRKVTFSAETPLGAMASSNDECATMVLWNPTGNTIRIRAKLEGLKFEEGRLQVYHIDESVNSWYETGEDELLPSVDSIKSVSPTTSDLSLRKLEIRPRGVLFIKYAKESAKPLFPHRNLARIVRTDQWYEKTRSNTAPYAYFDSKTWTARLSMCNKSEGQALVSVTAEELPQDIRVETTSKAIASRNANSTQALRVDFQSKNGAYISSVVFHGGIYNENRTINLPWGTRRKADKVVKVDNFKDFTFRVSEYAPSDFSGRAIFTFELTNTGVNSKCNMQLSCPEHISLTNIRVDTLESKKVCVSMQVEGDLSKISTAGFIYGLSDPMTRVNKINAATIEGQTLRIVLDKLRAHKDYYIRGIVISQEGDTLFTPLSVIHTPANHCELLVANVDCDTLALTAKITSKIESAPSDVYRRGLVWSLRSKNEMPTLNDNVVTSASKGTTFYTNLSGLKPETEYAVRTYTFSRAGLSLSEPTYFSTNPYVTGVDMPAEEETSVLGVYDLQGRRISQPRKGIYVTRFSNGTAIKQCYR